MLTLNKFWPPKILTPQKKRPQQNFDPQKYLTHKKQSQLQVWVLDLDWSLTISFGPKISWTNHISLLPSSGPAPAQQSWPGLALFSFPPDMWQKIHQICGRRSPRYVAEDHPDMWQKIRKSIFLSSLAKNISQILSFGFEGKTLCMPGSLSEPNQTLTRLGL